MKHIFIRGDTELKSGFVSWASIEPYFPYAEVRPIQKNLIRVIVTAITKGRTDIILQAPTGIGKSAVAMAIARYFEAQGERSMFYLPRKGLVDQYSKEFPDLGRIKGGNEYLCLLERKVLHDSFGIRVPRCTKDMAPCSIQQIDCNHKPFGDRSSGSRGIARSHSRGPLFLADDPCPFWDEKVKALNSNIVFMSSLYGYLERIGADDFGQVKFLVFDEADHVEKDLLSMETMRITEKDIDLFSDKPISLEGTEEEENEPKFWMAVLDMMIRGCTELIDDKEDKIDDLRRSGRGKFSAINRLEQELSHAKERKADYKKHFESMKKREDEYVIVFNVDVRSTGEVIKYVELKPAFISFRAPYHLGRGDIRLFMSATILNPLVFLQNLGIKDALYIEVPDSPFPVKNRRIKCHRIDNFNASNIKNLIQDINATIKQILEENPGKSGIIIPASHILRDQIYREQLKNFKPLLRPFGTEGIDHVTCPICETKLWQLFPHVDDAHKINIFQFTRLHPGVDLFAEKAYIITNTGESLERKRAMEVFTTNSHPRIWISTYPKEGFDGIDDICRLIVIPKIFFASLGDPMVKKRKAIQPSSYVIDALRATIQATGRGVRHKEDYCDIHILDGNIDNLIKQGNSMSKRIWSSNPGINVIPPWWQAAID